MAVKQQPGVYAPDGSNYVTLTDGAGNLSTLTPTASPSIASNSVTSATNVFLVSDTTGYGTISVQVTSPGTGCTITYEASEDGTTWYSVAGFTPLNVSTVSVTTSSSAILLVFPLTSKQFRARVSAYTSGTVTAQATMFADPLPKQTVFVGNNVSVTPIATTSLIGDVGVQYRPSATGGASTAAVMSPATPAATSIKATAGRLIGVVLQNSSASVRSVKFFNIATGGVTLGTTSALFELDIPAGGLLVWDIEGGTGFSTAITYAITGAKGLTDNTAITLNDVTGVAVYA